MTERRVIPLRGVHGAALAAAVGALMAFAATGQDVRDAQFTDVTAASGLAFTHSASKTAARFLPETMGGGVALLDYDGDGRLDVFFTNGAAIDAQMTSARRPDKSAPRFWNRLYRQVAPWQFEDVTERAGVAGRSYDFGVAVADYDNDGDPDLLVTGYGGSVLHRNEGDGTFRDVTTAAGLAGDGWPSSAGFVDYDGDGHLDLFVARYLEWQWESNVECREAGSGERSYCHPKHFAPVASALYRNRGDGTFADVSAPTGVGASKGKALGVAFSDVDRDGRIDIIVANDSTGQFLFRNTGGRFEETALESGMAYDEDGRSFSGMGIDVADYDNDTWPDVVVTTLSRERYALFRNTGRGQFAYATHTSGLGAITELLAGWGTRWIDVDHDGDLDLFVAQGHVMDTLTKARTGVDSRQPPLLVRNDAGRFTDASHLLGAAARQPRAGRGAAFGDIDNDGDVDIVVANLDEGPTLLRNDGVPGRTWLSLDLRGTSSNRDGIGAHVAVTDDTGRTQVRTVTTASSYQSASAARVHLGLGAARAVRRVEIRWPSGIVQVLTDIDPGQVLVVTEPRR